MVVMGIDVSKALLDVSMAAGPVHRFENRDPGLRRLLRHMDRARATQAVCEATGGYERLPVSRLGAAGITMQVAHPLRVRAFARACGHEVKTDALDARALARHGRVFPASDPSPSESGEARGELQPRLRRRRRRQPVDRRVRERNRLDKGVRPSVGPPGGISPGWTRRWHGWTGVPGPVAAQ